jgi:hypothetical protein
MALWGKPSVGGAKNEQQWDSIALKQGNRKPQAPTSKLQRNSKQKHRDYANHFEVWSLDFLWSLGLEVWSLIFWAV